MGGVVSPNPMELQYYNSSTHDDADGDTLLLLLLLSRCSRVRLCATPYTAAHQAPPSLVSHF